MLFLLKRGVSVDRRHNGYTHITSMSKKTRRKVEYYNNSYE